MHRALHAFVRLLICSSVRLCVCAFVRLCVCACVRVPLLLRVRVQSGEVLDDVLRETIYHLYELSQVVDDFEDADQAKLLSRMYGEES